MKFYNTIFIMVPFTSIKIPLWEILFSLCILSTLVFSTQAQTEGFTFSKTIGNHMLLQADAPTTALWGYYTPEASITVSIVGNTNNPSPSTINITVDNTGIWRAVFPSLQSTANPFNITFTDTTYQTQLGVLYDIVVGQNILCSGQSNMQLSLSMALNATEEIANINQYAPYIRVLYVGGNDQPFPQQDITGDLTIPWSRADNSTMGAASWNGFSATCWFYGRDLFNTLLALDPTNPVPVGLVESCVGGTSIRDWSPIEALAMCNQPYNSPIPYGPGPYEHSELYNGMIAPFGTGPMNFATVVWDQAESDSFPQTPIGYYSCATVAQITTWRKLLFNNAPVPWLFIHLQPYTGSGPCCLEDLRAMQLTALVLPNVGYATAIDLGDPSSPYGNVHFRDKQTIAARLVTTAQAIVYPDLFRYTINYPPPQFLTQYAYYNTSNNQSIITVAFSKGIDGNITLLSSPLNPCPNIVNSSNCTAFEILGSDGNAYPAIVSFTGQFPNGTYTQVSLILTAFLPPTVYGVGSAYAHSMWPNIYLYGTDNLPILPWHQALTLPGQPSYPPSDLFTNPSQSINIVMNGNSR